LLPSSRGALVLVFFAFNKLVFLSLDVVGVEEVVFSHPDMGGRSRFYVLLVVFFFMFSET
jgi:hypothetical protein